MATVLYPNIYKTLYNQILWILFFSLEKEQENYDSPSPDTSIWRKDKW